MKDGPERKGKIELSELEVPPADDRLEHEGEGPEGQPRAGATGDGPAIGDQLKGMFNEEEMKLFSELMRKVESTGELDKELNIDLSQFTERVESVVDSIERIENIERTQMERLLYKEGYPSDRAEASVPAAEPLPEAPESLGNVPGPSGPLEDGSLPIGSERGGSHITLAGSEPYAEVRSEGIPFYRDEGLSAAYWANIENVLLKLRKLVGMKIERDQTSEAKGLVNVAMKVSGGSETFVRNFADVMTTLGMELPQTAPSKAAKDVAGAEAAVREIGSVEEAKVLAPELAGEIGTLQRRARSALNQLRIMLDSPDIAGEGIDKVRALFLEANGLYVENRFHKAHQVALSALSTIKDRLKDSIDVQLQNDLFHAREALDELARSDEQYDVMVIEDLRDQLDRAMKFYLTNEYERANLLARSVTMALKDIKEPEGSRVKEMAATLRRELVVVKEQNQGLEGMKEAEETLSSVEELISKRNYTAAAKLAEGLRTMLEDLGRRSQQYTRAKEMNIRLTNRVSRLSQGGHDLREVEKKLGFLKGYFEEGRYEDSLLIGAEIETHLESMENLKKEMEAKEIFNELENLMLHVEEMEGSERLKEQFATLRSKYVIGEHAYVKAHGRELLETMRKKTKALSVERAKRISSSVIESKLLAMKLRSIDRDTMEYERASRKARTLMKEGNPVEGIRQLDRVNSSMREELQRNLDFLRNFVSIYRDSLEVLLDRHRSEPATYYIRNKQVPLLRKMEQLGRLNKALEGYRRLENRFSELKVPMDRRTEVESNLTELRYELYKRKDLGMDISEPLSIYNRAQKVLSEGKVVVAEYLTEVTKRYYESFLPV